MRYTVPQRPDIIRIIIMGFCSFGNVVGFILGSFSCFSSLFLVVLFVSFITVLCRLIAHICANRCKLTGNKQKYQTRIHSLIVVFVFMCVRVQPSIPVISLILCVIIRQERLTVYKALGVVFAVAGAVIGTQQHNKTQTNTANRTKQQTNKQHKTQHKPNQTKHSGDIRSGE